MKYHNNKAIIIGILGIVGIIIPLIFATQKQEKALSEAIVPHLLTKLNLQEAAHEPSLVLSDYPHLIKQQEEMLWQELAQHGITQEEYAQACATYQQTYDADIEIMKKRYSSSTPLSAQMVAFIHEIVREFGIDPTTITLISTNLASAAAATDTVLFVNESSVAHYTAKVKRFAIGHECTHIKNKDHSTRFYIKKACLDKGENISDWQHPYNKMRHLHEMRADITPSLKNLDYAQGCVEFYAKHMQIVGDYESADQPKSSLRLATATKIVTMLQNS